MSSKFEAVLRPTERDISELSAQYPSVPFFTPSYMQACAAGGEVPCAFLLRDGSAIKSGVAGSLRTGRLGASLQIPTASAVPDPQSFWQQVQMFCKKHRVWNLSVQTFASDDASIPPLAGESVRRDRVEHVLALRPGEPFKFSSNHRRNINKARRANVVLTTSRSNEDQGAHLRLMQQSIQRRTDRGETIAIPRETGFHAALLQYGAADLFQARVEGELLTSILILRSATSRYYHSAGSSKHGMELGSSAFLVAALAEMFAAEGLATFNLGGAVADEEGLWRFKTGFGGEQRQLQSVDASTEPQFVRVLKYLTSLPGRIRG
jgi:hypothetical protein